MIASILRCDRSQCFDTLTLIQRNGLVKCYVWQPTMQDFHHRPASGFKTVTESLCASAELSPIQEAKSLQYAMRAGAP